MEASSRSISNQWRTTTALRDRATMCCTVPPDPHRPGKLPGAGPEAHRTPASPVAGLRPGAGGKRCTYCPAPGLRWPKVGPGTSVRLGDDADVGLRLLPGAEDLLGLLVVHRAGDDDVLALLPVL